MPNKNSYTYMHNIRNDKLNEMEIDMCNCRNKDTCPIPNSYQTKTIIYQANIDYDIPECKQKCYLELRETAF